jgi:hypothetical protein
MGTRAGVYGLATLVTALVVTMVLPAGSAWAVAPGCTAARPTFIGGPIYGYPDNRSLNALIGLDLQDSSNRKVNLDGAPISTAGYSVVDRVNPGIPPEGSDDTTLDRTWGFCASAKVTEGFFEIYPKNQQGVTTKTRYGAAAHYRQPIVAGTAYSILLRLPLTWEAGGGNTGLVNGYITYQGHRVPPENITRVRAFTQASGPECGVEGFSASADALAYSQSLDATYYRIAYLAGGRCGATGQRYTLHFDCTTFCGATKRTVTREVDISQGEGDRVDIPF